MSIMADWPCIFVGTEWEYHWIIGVYWPNQYIVTIFQNRHIFTFYYR